jgi:itaconyl-CoA hydratase
MSLSAYEQIAQNRFRERFGLDFEDFDIGQRYRHRPGVTVSQQDNVDEALDTMNSAMIHYDARYSAQTTWKKELMVSTVTLQKLIGMSSKTFASKHSIVGFNEIAMTRPVFGGDTLYAESEIINVRATEEQRLGEVSVICHGINQDGDAIAKITYRVLVWRRGEHPQDVHTESGELLDEPRFLAHRLDDDGVLTEQVGLFFEDCQAGETFIHWPRRTMLRDEGIKHARRALELSPQYHDIQWQKNQPDGEFRFLETWVIAVVTAMTTRTFGRVVANLGWTDISFAALVAPEDTLEAESTILDKRESKSRPNEGILSVETRAHNQRGELVLSYRRKLLVYKRDADTPYAAAGY